MNKKERATEIRKLAYEYAKSGEHQSWLTIEHRITADGFPEANTELDVQYIRNELISLCQKANSQEEVTRRDQFKIWLEEIVSEVAPIITKTKPEVYVTTRDNILYINGPSFLFEIRRRFYSNELEIIKEFEKDCKRFRTNVFDKIEDTDFNKIKGNDAVRFILQLIQKK